MAGLKCEKTGCGRPLHDCQACHGRPGYKCAACNTTGQACPTHGGHWKKH